MVETSWRRSSAVMASGSRVVIMAWFPMWAGSCPAPSLVTYAIWREVRTLFLNVSPYFDFFAVPLFFAADFAALGFETRCGLVFEIRSTIRSQQIKSPSSQ